jgi:2-amino-4-hydroxy-6-hydroxymethyldihydropteridine diphosphokinase
MSRAGRVRAYIGLGSNVGDPPATLRRAVLALDALPGVRVRAVSPLYLARPVGVTDQPDFHNAVVALDVPAGANPETGALALLAVLKDLERALGRREGRRWGPREADLDLLVFGRARVRVGRPAPADGLPLDPASTGQDGELRENGSAAAAAGVGTRSGASARRLVPRGATPPPRLLEVPHPAARDRLFVLVPLADLAPGLVPPGWGETVDRARRRREAVERPGAVLLAGTWAHETRGWKLVAASARQPGRGGA